MAVTTASNRVQYNGNGAITKFPVSFYFLNEADIIVIITDVNDQDTTQILTSQYTVSGAGVEVGGFITMVTAPVQGEKLTFLRHLPTTQAIDYVQGESFPADTYDTSLDRLTMIFQQLDEQLDRTILASASSVDDPSSLFPDPVEDYYLQYDSDGVYLLAVPYLNLNLHHIVEDLTPQLGYHLETNTYYILFDDATGFQDDSGNEQLIFQLDAFSVNYMKITNARATFSPTFTTAGADPSIGLSIDTQLAGTLTFGSADVPFLMSSSSITMKTGGSVRLDITDAGVRFGETNSRIVTILDEDDFISDSDTALATQQSIKAYIDAHSSGIQADGTTAKTDTFSTTSTSFVDVTGVSVAITPESTNSKILIMVNPTVAAGSTAMVNLVRDSTDLLKGDTSGSKTSCSNATRTDGLWSTKQLAIYFLDSPNTTSSVTYKLQMKVNSGTAYLNRSYDNSGDIVKEMNSASSIVVLELA